MRQFCQAILDMVEVGDLREIESLANRLRPYRVEPYNTTAPKLKLVLEEDPRPRSLGPVLDEPALSTLPARARLDGISDSFTSESAAGGQAGNSWPGWLLTPTSLSSPPVSEEYAFTPAEVPSFGSEHVDLGGDMFDLSFDSNTATALGITLCDDAFGAGLLSPSSSPVGPVADWSAGRPVLSAQASQTCGGTVAGTSDLSLCLSFLHPAEMQRYIRSDCASYLQENTKRWLETGIWQHTEFPSPRGVEASCDGLRIVYRCICRLEMRMEDDAIRNRAAIIALHDQYERNVERAVAAYWATGQTSRGRGYASVLVDDILAQIHGADWTAASPGRRKELRAKFHDRKRYGKRWSALAQSAGHGILFLCAQQLVAIVNNTRVSCEHLRVLGDMLLHADADAAKVLQGFNRTAQSLIHGRDDND